MADSLPVLPPEIYEIIARMYRVYTTELRFSMGWWQVHQELLYLPRCPKGKRLLTTRGFYVVLNNPKRMATPVTGYFYRQMVKSMLRATDPARLECFCRFFRKGDVRKPYESPEWVVIYCKRCRKEHYPWDRKLQEQKEWQTELRVYIKKMRRVTRLKTRREWLTRLRPRRPKIVR